MYLTPQPLRNLKSASHWAAEHPCHARWSIVGVKILLAASAIVLGWLLAGEIHRLTIPGLAVIFTCAVLIYPYRIHSGDYLKRKYLDLLLCLCSFGLIVCAANQKAQQLFASPVTHVSTPTALPVVHKKSDTKQWKKQQRQLKRQQRKAFKRELISTLRHARNNLSPGAKVALVVLAVLILAIGLAGVSAWSCELSCSGMDGAAALVAIGGTLALVFLGILMFRGIFGRKKKRAQNGETIDRP